MAKTLVIKGANFSENKVATIEFDRIHTTGFEITDESISLTHLGGTHRIAYTLTPADAEDPVTWASSNESVCTVDGNGIVTATGCGTATITGTSNGHSDTCTVECVIEMSGFIRAPKSYIGSQSSSSHAASADSYIGLSQTGYDIYMLMTDADNTKTKLSACINFAKLNSETSKYEIPATFDGMNTALRIYNNIGFIIPVKLPANCNTLTLLGLNEHYAPYVMFYKSDTRAASSDAEQAYFSAYKKASPTPNNYSWVYKQTTEVSVDAGYDSVTVMWKADTANGAVDFANLTAEQITQFKLICS